MEKQLFEDINGADQVGDMIWTFYNPTLRVAIGPHIIGEKFTSATIDFEFGILELYKGDATLVFKGRFEFNLLTIEVLPLS